MPLIASMLFALIAADVHASTCDDAEANKLFVIEANKVSKARKSPRDRKLAILQEALNGLKGITMGEHSCTSLAVRLASGERIGEISIAGLERQIALLEKAAPGSCRDTSLYDAVISALEIENDDVRNDAFATIARKLVRRGIFLCARELVELIDEHKKRNGLRHAIARAQARVSLKQQRCCSWPWQ